jgi:hypothetical protein
VGKVFYTYLWLREDGTPYYVGKGTGRRAFRRSSPPEERIVIQEFPTEDAAFLAERLLISLYGRKDLQEGLLINRSDGGDGISNVSESTRQRMSAFQKQRLHAPHSLETRLRIAEGQRGNKRGPETSRKISEKAKQRAPRVQSAEERAKKSASLKNRKFSAETIKKMRVAARVRNAIYGNGMLGRKHTAESREKQHQKAEARYAKSV